MESEDFVFVKFRSKITYCFWKVSAWLSKLDGANMEGFLGKRSFFLVESMFSRLFLDIRQMFSELWKQIVKIVSLSVQMNFSWKNFTPGKMLKLIVFFRTGAGVGGGVGLGFRNFVEKRFFGGKLSGELSERDSTFPEWLFEERRVFPKNFQWILFSNVQHNFSFLSFFGMFIKKASPCPYELIEENFLWLNTFFEFFQKLSRILSYFVNNTSTNCQICVSSVFLNFFKEIFFTWKLISSWKTFSGNRDVCFREI